MGVYFMASIQIRDEQDYQHYLDRADDIFARYRGTYLAVDKQAEVLEGTWDYSRAVLIHFESRADFDAWYRSEDYQTILQFRLSAAKCDSILIKGKSIKQILVQ
jgi:uncharacterized protein (DUF1330 family)